MRAGVVQVPHAKHDPKYQHSSIDLLLLKRKRVQQGSQPK